MKDDNDMQTSTLGLSSVKTIETRQVVLSMPKYTALNSEPAGTTGNGRHVVSNRLCKSDCSLTVLSSITPRQDWPIRGSHPWLPMLTSAVAPFPPGQVAGAGWS